MIVAYFQLGRKTVIWLKVGQHPMRNANWFGQKQYYLHYRLWHDTH